MGILEWILAVILLVVGFIIVGKIGPQGCFAIIILLGIIMASLKSCS